MLGEGFRLIAARRIQETYTSKVHIQSLGEALYFRAVTQQYRNSEAACHPLTGRLQDAMIRSLRKHNAFRMTLKLGQEARQQRHKRMKRVSLKKRRQCSRADVVSGLTRRSSIVT